MVSVKPMAGFERASNFLVVGCIRNCSRTLRDDVERLKMVMAGKNIKWILVESDSADDTLDILKAIAERDPLFRYISLGRLANRLPLRTARIAYCRNQYIEAMRGLEYDLIEYVVVADFDGVNNLLTRKAFISCWRRDDWDVCTANQAAPYYDIWALRHSLWSPNDCWRQYRFLLAHGIAHERSIDAAVYSKMLTIPPESAWIEVDSAFGGLAVYKKQLFEVASYDGLDEIGEETCEHVELHRSIKERGGSIWINPELINTKHTEHGRPTDNYQKIIGTSKLALKSLVGGLKKGWTLLGRHMLK